MPRHIAILLLGFLAACSSAPHPNERLSFVLRTKEILLSRQHLEDDFIKARLVSIAQDGATTIQSLETGDILQAAPGEYFAPGPYGFRGLQLLSASAEMHEAHLLRTWCGPER
jgi:hypothetical protein